MGDIFSFHFNSYALIFLSAAVADLILFLFILSRRVITDAVFWFLIFLASAFALALAQSFAGISSSQASFEFWNLTDFLSLIAIAPAMVYFAKAYTKSRYQSPQIGLGLLFLIISGVLTYLVSNTNLLWSHQYSQAQPSPWGPLPKQTNYILLFSVYYLAVSLYMFYRFYILYQKTSATETKKQARLIITAISLPVILGLIFEGFLPFIIHDYRVFPASVPAIALMCVIIAYALFRSGITAVGAGVETADIADIMPSALLKLDSKQHITYVNSAGERLFGYSVNQLVGHDMRLLIPDDNLYHEFLKHVISPLQTKGRLRLAGFTMTNQSGQPLSTDISATSTKSRSDEVFDTILVISDITELNKKSLELSHLAAKEQARNQSLEDTKLATLNLLEDTKKLQQQLEAEKASVEKQVAQRTYELRYEQQTLKTLLDSLPVGVFVAKAPDGEPIMINEMGIQLLGKGLKQDLKLDSYSEYFDMIKEDGSLYPANELPISIAMREGKGIFKDDVVVRHSDGSLMPLRIISSPVVYKDDRVRTAVAVFEDISKERELERSKDEFFSIASHELRTPLTAIKGNTSLIQQYYGDKLSDPELKEMVSDIHESANRLIEIVNDFLDTSRLEQKRMKYVMEPLDMFEVTESVLKEYHVTGSRQKVMLEARRPDHTLPPVNGDRNRVKQVLINLIGNALKFTERGSITVSFTTDGQKVTTHVKDTGKGINPEAQKLLFHKFEQTGSEVLTRDSVRGTGLGLYISKMMMEQMHGGIRLESSEVGVGTTFSLWLPISARKETGGNPLDDINSAAHDRRVHSKSLKL